MHCKINDSIQVPNNTPTFLEFLEFFSGTSNGTQYEIQHKVRISPNAISSIISSLVRSRYRIYVQKLKVVINERLKQIRCEVHDTEIHEEVKQR